MTASDLLKLVANEVRTYATTAYNTDHLEHMIRAYTAAYGGEWSQGLRMLPFKPDSIDYQTQHLIKFGGEGLSRVEHHFGITLPDTAHVFYREVAECVLSLKNVIVVMAPADIIAYESEIRDFCEDQSLVTPIRIIRFAQILGEPFAFAFRKSCTDDKWRVTFISSTSDSLEDFHTPKFDGVEKDEDIDAWMKRMIRTDGFPLMVGNERYEHYGAIRVA